MQHNVSPPLEVVACRPSSVFELDWNVACTFVESNSWLKLLFFRSVCKLLDMKIWNLIEQSYPGTWCSADEKKLADDRAADMDFSKWKVPKQLNLSSV